MSHRGIEGAGPLLKTHAFINGEWLATAKLFEVRDPATNELLAEVSNTDKTHASVAIDAAHAALADWQGRPAHERSRILRRWFELVRVNADALAALLTAEQGKPLAEALAEITYGSSFIEWFAEEARRVYGDVSPTPANDRRIIVIKQAIGVCAAITPWNFPVAMVTRKVAPALAAGCTIILKPAEQTPLCALALAELSLQAGIPPGVLNVLSCDGDNGIAIGKVLCASPRVRHLSFTGSTEVGRILMAQCAPTVKKLALELGGHAPFIVFDDADLDAAVEGAMISKYRNAGQTCVCTNRFIVQAGIHDAFVERLVARTQKIRVGNGFEPNVEQGPLIDDAGVAKVVRHIEDARNKGAQLLTGGTPPQGQFVTPTVMTNVTSDMLIAREETFGPVSAVMKFSTDEEAVALANASEFGLAAYFYSRDIGRVWRVAEALEYGMVGINTGAISYETVPFGGIKQSGFGREGSRHGIEEYVEMKYLCMAGL